MITVFFKNGDRAVVDANLADWSPEFLVLAKAVEFFSGKKEEEEVAHFKSEDIVGYMRETSHA